MSPRDSVSERKSKSVGQAVHTRVGRTRAGRGSSYDRHRWFGSDRPRRTLLISSGLHGVEGFAGSATQLQFLDKMQFPPDDTAVVLFHSLNPYGMAWLRRVNEQNVDLNRNFLAQDDRYAGAPSGYERWTHCLTLRKCPRLTSSCRGRSGRSSGMARPRSDKRLRAANMSIRRPVLRRKWPAAGSEIHSGVYFQTPEHG